MNSETHVNVRRPKCRWQSNKNASWTIISICLLSRYWQDLAFGKRTDNILIHKQYIDTTEIFRRGSVECGAKVEFNAYLLILKILKYFPMVERWNITNTFLNIRIWFLLSNIWKSFLILENEIELEKDFLILEIQFLILEIQCLNAINSIPLLVL